MSTDSLYFNNIAKLRALRFLVESLKEKFTIPEFEILCSNSLREQTLYDPWVNMLRASMSLTASINGGADKLLNFSYDKAAEQEFDYTLTTLGLRQAENAFFVLTEESFLGTVSDPCAGAYIIEKLTNEYIDLSFKAFLELEREGGLFKNIKKWSLAVELTALKREERFLKQEVIHSGANGFSNLDEKLSNMYGKRIKNKHGHFPLRRVSQKLENLRFQLEDKVLKNYVILMDDTPEALARLKFSKNYLETIGHSFTEIRFADISKMPHKDGDILILCGEDESYLKAKDLPEDFSFKLQFVVSKNVDLEGFDKIYKGKNIFNTFASLIKGDK